MNAQLTTTDLLDGGYRGVYGSLTELREVFHRSGRFDDSNAKLDEVAKLFATYLAHVRGHVQDFPDPSSRNLVAELQSAFGHASLLPHYRLSDGTSIFSTTGRLALRPGDEHLAAELVSLVKRSVDLAFEARAAGSPFDILNEAFGHFIRDNFRGNIEDAQYMTPPEVVDFMAELALHDLGTTDNHAHDLVILDPTCGVGSFLTAVYNKSKGHPRIDTGRLRLFGQDKVDRMVRLATLNLELFEVAEHRITIGNSLALGSPLDELNGKVDLILTNPPFGARFDRSSISAQFGSNTPFFSSLHAGSSAMDSELLFVDRNLQLLKDGGSLLIVVPDGVISARGIAAMLRHHLSRVATLRAIVELPSVTFAQAGTRTRTAVLYLKKTLAESRPHAGVFMGVAGDLGFQVGTRKGVQVKVATGTNDLPKMLDAYRSASTATTLSDAVVLSADPSAVLAPQEALRGGGWTPNHYHAQRYRSLIALKGASEFELAPLGELVDFCADARSLEKHAADQFFISVLHVLGEGLLDIAAIRGYAPKTPGVAVGVGEILFSRINPRIPRVCIVPNLGRPTVCSTEFEIMRPRVRVSAYALTYLLQTQVVQEQVKSLTSGTSASHNRIRTSDLAQVVVPVPRTNSAAAATIKRIEGEYQAALDSISASALGLSELRGMEPELFLIGHRAGCRGDETRQATETASLAQGTRVWERVGA